MRTLSTRLLATLALALACALPGCAGRAHQPLTLTLAHVNDTHSALQPSEENLTLFVDGASRVCRTQLGGMARLKSALDDVRAHAPNVLTLHAGDAVQGTLYFNIFGGAAEFDFLNALGVDAMALGNHEFDRGPAQLAHMLAATHFPILAANIDAAAEPELAARVRPYVVHEIAGEKVALVGLITPLAPSIVKDVGRVRFLDPAPVLTKIIADLKARDINKVIVLSHLGYAEDLALARAVPGIDVIVGGHSHTLLGDAAAFGQLGLAPTGPYPARVQGPQGTVLVVQAWKWAEELGVLTVRFDPAGHVAGFTAAPTLLPGDAFILDGRPVGTASPEHAAILTALAASGVARIYPEDPDMLRKLAPYKEKVATLQNASLGAEAAVDLIRGTATDPGPIIADAYLARIPRAQLALVGAGGIRHDILAGPVTLGDVMAVSPFNNTLVVMDITGAQLKEALEGAVDFRITKRPPADGDLSKLPVIHPAGFVYAVHPLRPLGRRVDGLMLRRADGTLAPIDPATTYRLVTNSFLAGGGDGMPALKAITAGRMDAGDLEHDALAEYLTRLGAVTPPADVLAGPRVRVEMEK